MDEFGMLDALEEEERDGEDVGAEEAGDDERDDGVKSDRGADVDEREEAGYQGRETDGIEGEFSSRFDLENGE